MAHRGRRRRRLGEGPARIAGHPGSVRIAADGRPAGQHQLAVEEWAIGVLQAATQTRPEHLLMRELVPQARRSSA
jgi:hypothetical protein